MENIQKIVVSELTLEQQTKLVNEAIKRELRIDWDYGQKIDVQEELMTAVEAACELMGYYEAVKEQENFVSTESKAKQIINMYTHVTRNIAFDELLELDDPLLELTKELMFETIALDKKNFSTKEVERQLSAIELKNYAKETGSSAKVGYNPDWHAVEEKAGAYMVYNKAKRIGYSTRVEEFVNSYHLSSNAIKQEFPAIAKPELKGSLRMYIVYIMNARYKPEDAMDWDKLITDVDVEYFEGCMYSKDSRNRLSVKSMNCRKATNIFTDIAHHHYKNEPYNMIYRKKK